MRPTGLVRPVAITVVLALVGCGGAAPTPTAKPPTHAPPPTTAPANTPVPPTSALAPGWGIGVILGEGAGDGDPLYAGAQAAAKELGAKVTIATPKNADLEKALKDQIAQGSRLIVTYGYLPNMPRFVATAAQAAPGVHFVIVDYTYTTSDNCGLERNQAVSDCYSELYPNVTSLSTAVDEGAFAAGVVAGCMSQKGKVGIVAGMEIPVVRRLVVGYQNGARYWKDTIQTPAVYTGTFTDPKRGEAEAQKLIAGGADVILVAAGATGNGALKAAADAGVLAVGVDSDQWVTYPAAKKALLTSVIPHYDVTVAAAIRAFAKGELKAGPRLIGLADGAVELAPYHDLDSKVPQECKDRVEKARSALSSGALKTGYVEGQ